MTRALLAVTAVLAVLAGFTGWGYLHTRDALQIEQTRTEALSRALTQVEERRLQEQAIALKYVAQVRTLRQQKSKSDEALKKALAENASWADAVVPGSVRDALGL